MEIYIKQLHHKYQVKQSNRNMRKVYTTQLKMAKVNDIANKPVEDQIKEALDLTDTLVNFVKEVLSLKGKYADMIDDQESAETIEIASYICQRIMGLTDKQIEEGAKEDPKK